MTTPFIGEIRMFGGNFAPTGWSYCNGQIIQADQNEALFSLLGSVYGGNGRTTFALPDLQSRIPIHKGQGPGLTNRALGAKGGTETETVTTSTMPQHRHTMLAASTPSDQTSPIGHIYGPTTNSNTGNSATTLDDTATTTMNSGMLSTLSGSGQAHVNSMPIQGIHFIIALVGVMPTQN